MGSLLIALLCLLGVAPASASAAESLSMYSFLSDDGSGRLRVAPAKTPLKWEVCTSQLTDCKPLGDGEEVTTNGAPPGSVLRVTDGYGSVGLSPVWHGNVAAVTPPSVSGALQANQLVTPVPGGWSGGWDGGQNLLQLSVCSTAMGQDCVALTHPSLLEKCAGESAVLDPAFVGDYLRVANSRQAPSPFVMPPIGIYLPYAADTWTVGPRISASIFGPIAPAAGARTTACGPPPLNSASISKQGLASVECGLGCRAVLVAKRGRGKARIKARVMREVPRRQPSPPMSILGVSPIPLQEPISLQPPRWFSKRADKKRAHLILKINGETVARRVVRLPL